MQRTGSLEKTLMLGKMEGKRRRDDRVLDGWMASQTQQTWVWVSSRSWWWIGEPGMLQFMESQRVRHDWATESNWSKGAEPLKICLVLIFIYGVRWGFNELPSTGQHNLLTMPSTLHITLSLEYRTVKILYFFLFICVSYHFAVNIIILQVISYRSFLLLFFFCFKLILSDYSKIYVEE